MTPNLRMEQHSFTYVKAIAAQAGYKVNRPDNDTDSVDGVLMSDLGRRPRIDFQAKATSQDVLSDGTLRFALPVHNYNNLRAETLTPRILVVLLMPQEETNWLIQSEEELCLRYCAYWLSLEGEPETSNTFSVTVQIPTANVFSVNQLNHLMDRVNRGESLC